MKTYAAKPHTVRAGTFGMRGDQQIWNVEVAPGEHLLLTDEAFRARYGDVASAPDEALVENARLRGRIAELEAAIRDDVIEPFDDGLGVASSNYRRLREVLDRGATCA